MEANKPLVVVLSRNYSTGLSVIRSLGAAGYAVDLVASSYKEGVSKIASCSKYVRKSVEVVSKKIKGNEEAETEQTTDPLLEELLKYAGQNAQKPVLFPTDDFTTSVMDKYRSLLSDIFIMPTIVGGGDGCLTSHMDKTFQADLARKVGLQTPQEWIFNLEEEIVIPEDMVFPCFVKPIESVTGYKKEMAKCKTAKGLRSHLRKLQKSFSGRCILVQEFLKIDKEIDFSGVCLDQEIIIPAIIKKWNVAKYEKGVTLAGKVVPTDELGQELLDKIVQMLKQFHYVGMFDMELNVVGDQIYFNEVNLRSGGPNYSYFKSGVNLPALFVKEAMGERHTPEEEKVTQFGKSFIYEKVAWEDYLHGFMSKRELEARIAAADITLLTSEDDPAPGRYFMRQMRKTLRRRKLKKIRNRWQKKLRRRKRKLRKAIRKFKKGVRKTIRKIKKSIKKSIKRCIKRTKKNIKRMLRPVVKLLRKTKHLLLGYPQAKKENRRNPFAESPRVLVAGRNFCSNLCMARSLGQAGYEVEILRIFQVLPKRTNMARYMRPDAYSKYIKAYHVCVSKRKAPKIVKKLIKIADPYRKMLLIPADDLVADVVDTYRNKLKKYYIMPNVNDKKGEISRLMSKEVQKDLALEAGLPVVNSCVIRAYKGSFEIPETVTYPCFIKPNISKNSSKSRMRRCDSQEELEAALTEFSKKKKIEMLVEDFMEIDKEYSILGLSTKEGVVSPGFFVAEVGGHDGHRGVALVGRVVSCDEEKQLIDEITKFVASLNFDGLFDVDLIMTPDGRLLFTELNLRFGASGYAITESGVNLPGMFADYMLKGKPIDLDCKINEPGKRFISEKVMLDEYMWGYLTKQEMMDYMDEMDVHFIYNKEDPKAYNHFKKFIPIATFAKKLKERKAAKAQAEETQAQEAQAEEAQAQEVPEQVQDNQEQA